MELSSEVALKKEKTDWNIAKIEKNSFKQTALIYYRKKFFYNPLKSVKGLKKPQR